MDKIRNPNPQSQSDFHSKVDRHFQCRFLLALLFALSASLAGTEAKPVFLPARHAEAPAKRRSVIDYFNLLPSYGDSTAPKERRELLQFGTNPDINPTIDTRDDYLLIHPDSETDYNSFTLFRLQNGRLQDVTRQMLPMPPQTDRLLYELPQFGTTVRVYQFKLGDKSGRHVFDLQWRGGRFVKVQ